MKRNLKKMIPVILMLLTLALGCSSLSAFAATKVTTITKKGTWVNTEKYVQYKVGKKTVKGLNKIDKKTYYFDSKGIQRTGWQRIDGDYYYFNIANGKDGSMVKNKVVNNITLDKTGKAVTKGNSAAKLRVLWKANQVMQSCTYARMTQAAKLKSCWEYCLKNYAYRGQLKFYWSAHWEQIYAERMIDQKHGACYEYGATFAFLANACGYTAYAVSSGGHGWAEINNLVYDLSWVRVDRAHNYFGMPFGTRGAKVPGYASARKYVVKI